MKSLQQLMLEAKDSGSITVIAKVTNLCNFSCPYCYNREAEMQARANPDCVSIMPMETMDRILFNMARYYEHGTLILHGGEPLFPGLSWYESFVELLQKYRTRYRVVLDVTIQSNGTLLNEQLLKLFKDNQISMGFSFDGLHNDLTRGHTEEILKAMKSYQTASGQQHTGAICLVTQHNVDSLIEEFEYFNALGFGVQFNPVFPAQHADDDLMLDNIVDRYVEGQCRLFNHYVTSLRPNIAIAEFDGLMKAALGDYSQLSCENIVCNYRWICVTPSGDYYPCGREWPEDYHFGNIRSLNFSEAFASEKYQRFAQEVMQKMEHCKYETKCPVFNICHGACHASSVMELGNASLPAERECAFRRGIFTHIYNYIHSKQPIFNEHVLRDVLKRSNKHVT